MKSIGRNQILFLSSLSLCVAGFGFRSPRTQVISFSTDVAPILKASCVKCHGANDPDGGLDVSTYAALMKSGTVVPGKSEQSRLLERILGHGGKARMPKGFAPLSEKANAAIRNWINQGAKDSAVKKTHWAFVAPARPRLPAVKNAQWVRNPIDAFVLAKIEQAGLKPSEEADRPTLIRRLTLDLTGLPPTPPEVEAFVGDRLKGAYERVVARLLASKHFGEKMALPWLDAARYADSNGFQQDGDTHQWVWRDWVVKAFNENKPFDEFTREQLAGDLTPNPSEDQLIATAFNRNHMLNGEGGAIAEEQRNVILFDRVDTTATTWLGLTMACARCHDHKYDPISQKDYFKMMAFFNNVPESGVPSGGGQYRIADPAITVTSARAKREIALLENRLKEERKSLSRIENSPSMIEAERLWQSLPNQPKDASDLIKIAPEKRTKEQAAKLHGFFMERKVTGEAKRIFESVRGLQSQLDAAKAKLPRVMVMSDSKPRKTFIYARGNYDSPTVEVAAGTPGAVQPALPTKNRLGLANWILSPLIPLTARVQVNRMWQSIFAKGLVRTPENFGIQSEPPTHPELLDWLAVDFRESKWDMKRLVRLIVTSATYRQSSQSSAAMLKVDPDNRFLARAPRYRMSSLILRDVALASSGLLNSEFGGKPVYPYQPAGIWDGLSITLERDFTYPQSKGSDLYRRSLYSFWRRTVTPGNMFDASSRQVCTVRPSLTSTPLHALIMMNDVTWVEAGRALATRVMSTQKTQEGRLTEAFLRVCSRRPKPVELSLLRRALDRSMKEFSGDPASAKAFLSQGASAAIPSPELAAYASVCLAIFNLDEAMTRE